jgi:hypothetical protein
MTRGICFAVLLFSLFIEHEGLFWGFVSVSEPEVDCGPQTGEKRGEHASSHPARRENVSHPHVACDESGSEEWKEGERMPSLHGSPMS